MFVGMDMHRSRTQACVVEPEAGRSATATS